MIVAQPLPPSPDEDQLRPLIGRVTDTVVHLLATRNDEAADLLEGQAFDCKSVADWTALAEIADEALRNSVRPLEVAT